MRIHRRLFIGLLALLTLLPAFLHASVFDPSHPLWHSPAIDTESFRAELLELRRRNAKMPGVIQPPSAGLDKVFRAPSLRFLVIPVLFADSGEAPVSIGNLQARLFDQNNPGSFTSYWSVASRGRFVPTGRIVPWQRLPGLESEYRNVRGGQLVASATRRMAEDAICAAASLVDLQELDNDGPDGIAGNGDDDGIVDLLLILQPRRGIEILVESEGFAALQDRVDLDITSECGLTADPFVVASVHDPLGVWVHESGHLLGLVDLYDLTVPANQTESGRAVGGLGNWSLMATGTWAGDGHKPSDLDAYSRSLLGWGEALDASSGGNIVLTAPSPTQAQWIELRPAVDWGRERFILESRVPAPAATVDGALPGQGVLIYRVEESRDCNGLPTPIVEVLAADGQRDIELLRNLGDAGDPYTGLAGAWELGPATNPSSWSRTPASTRKPPQILISPARGGVAGEHAVEIRLSVDPLLRPVAMLFEESPTQRRSYLLPGESRSFQPAFHSVGSSFNSARLSVSAMSPQLTASTSGPVDLTESGGEWRLQDEIILSVAAGVVVPDDLFLQLTLDFDGGPSQVLDLNVPVALSTGLGEGDFASWRPRVLDAGTAQSRFEAVSSFELPAMSSSGWGTTADNGRGYGNCADLSLESPWFSVGQDMTFQFWSSSHTEESDPGEIWDGGVVEIQHAGEMWLAMEPTGAPLLWIRPSSEAETAARLGFGGAFTPWRAYELPLAASQLPVRLRFHFSSDASIVPLGGNRGWALAGAGTDVAFTPANVTLREIAPRHLEVNVQFTIGAVPDAVDLRYRRPPSSQWIALSGSIVPLEGRVSQTVQLPEGVDHARIGVFDGEGSSRLLGEAAYRIARNRVSFRAYPNPATGPVHFELEASSVSRSILIWDLRGRRVRRLEIPPDQALVSWDGRDDGGGGVASGRYVAMLAGTGEIARLTLLR